MKTTGYIIAAVLAALTGLAAIVPSLAAALVHVVQAAKEHLAKIGLLPLLAAGCCLCLPSCAGVLSGITGQAPHSTAVQREGGKPVRIVTSDLLQAESGNPEAVHGLYDVGLVAAGVGKVVDVGK